MIQQMFVLETCSTDSKMWYVFVQSLVTTEHHCASKNCTILFPV